MSRLIALLRAEPALAATVVQYALALAMALHFSLTPGQTGGIEAAASAAAALVVAAATRPFRVAALTGFIGAGGTCLIAFGVPHVTTGAVSAASALLTTLLMAHVSLRVTPVVNLPQPATPPRAVPAPGGAGQR